MLKANTEKTWKQSTDCEVYIMLQISDFIVTEIQQGLFLAIQCQTG